MENKFKRRQEIIDGLKAEKCKAEARPTIHILQGTIHIHSKPLQESTQQRPRQNTMLGTRSKTFAWMNAEQEKQYQ